MISCTTMIITTMIIIMAIMITIITMTITMTIMIRMMCSGCGHFSWLVSAGGPSHDLSPPLQLYNSPLHAKKKMYDTLYAMKEMYDPLYAVKEMYDPLHATKKIYDPLHATKKMYDPFCAPKKVRSTQCTKCTIHPIYNPLHNTQYIAMCNPLNHVHNVRGASHNALQC